ncbi:MAG: hypothetical protein IBX69_16055, partial [Anaerolineales bacterium]|nr:hypothetical protein [Anaerolineales bacterium]
IQNLQRFWRAGLALLFIFLAFAYGRASFEWVQASSQRGIGFSAVAWKSSPILTTMQNIPSETLVYTNIPEGVYFNGQHRSLRLPIYYEAVRQQVNPDFEAEIEYAKQRLASGQVVVLFFTQLGRQENPSEGELVHRLGLELLAAQPDGNLYISNVSTGQLLP